MVGFGLRSVALPIFAAQTTHWVVHHCGENNGPCRFGAYNLLHKLIIERSAWPARTHVDEMVLAASPYLRDDLDGEAILTLGGPIHEHRQGLIDGVVSVGPLDCMPNKIAEALFFHVGEREKLLSLTIPLNGEPFDIALLDDFVFELRRRFEARGRVATPARKSARANVNTFAV